MKFVEPIRDRKKIAQIKNLLRGQQRYCDLLLFVIGINAALRISDLLQLRLSQFLDETGKIKTNSGSKSGNEENGMKSRSTKA